MSGIQDVSSAPQAVDEGRQALAMPTTPIAASPSAASLPQQAGLPAYPASSPYATQPMLLLPGGYPQPGQVLQPGYHQARLAQAGTLQQHGYPQTPSGYLYAGPPLTPAVGNGTPPQMPPVAAQPTGSRAGRSRVHTATLVVLTCLLAMVFAVGLFSGWTYARSTASQTTAVASSPSSSTTTSTALDSQTAREAAIAKVTPAVVEVIGQMSQGTALGSGVIIDKNGDIITNNHVVAGTSQIQVQLNNGHLVTARLVGSDTAHDLAILRIQPYTGMVVATLGDSSQLTIGQEVLAIGNPLGYSSTATSGVVSALNRSAEESRTVNLTGLIQISTPINPGNSGGALINLQGQLIGIPTLSAVNSETNTPANGIGFAIPSSQVQATIKQILG